MHPVLRKYEVLRTSGHALQLDCAAEFWYCPGGHPLDEDEDEGQ